MYTLPQELPTHAPPHSDIPVRSGSDLSLEPIVVVRIVMDFGFFVRRGCVRLGLRSRNSPQPVNEKGRLGTEIISSRAMPGKKKAIEVRARLRSRRPP